jgi:hypothetical protein
MMAEDRTELVDGVDQPAGWELPTMEGEAAQIMLRMEVLTGLGLDANGAARPLDPAAWHNRKERLAGDGRGRESN